MRLQDEVAIVTGSGSGIGRATAVRFAEEGAKVVVVDINRTGGEETVLLVKETGGHCLFVSADISKEKDAKRIAETAITEFGQIDVLVNNAAAFIFKGLDATVAEWHRSLSINVVGTALCSKYAVEEMKKRGRGAIVNLGSISGVIAQPEFVAYSVTKAAVMQMTRNMAMDLAQFNIRVNCVCPGAIQTPVFDVYAQQKGVEVGKLMAEWAPAHLLNRLGEPREVANAILFLASEEASFITGTCLMVDGGYTVK